MPIPILILIKLDSLDIFIKGMWKKTKRQLQNFMSVPKKKKKNERTTKNKRTTKNHNHKHVVRGTH